MKKYTLNYRDYEHGEVKEITVEAANKVDAYFNAADALEWRFYSLWNR